MTNTDIPTPEVTITDVPVTDVLDQIEAINAIVDNYNVHKSDKNKELTTKEVRIIAIVDTPHYEEFLLITGRNDGLLYSIQVERITKKVTLFLYNRIARTVLNEGAVV